MAHCSNPDCRHGNVRTKCLQPECQNGKVINFIEEIGERMCQPCFGSGRVEHHCKGGCKSCNWSGLADCRPCGGTGWIEYPKTVRKVTNCEVCGGKGYTEQTCSHCKGRGHVEKERSVTIQSCACPHSIDIPGARAANYSILHLWSYHGGDNQVWYINPVPSEPNLVYIESWLDSRRMDMGGVIQNGAPVFTWDPIDGNLNQLWRLERLDDGSYKIISEFSGYCLEVDNSQNGSLGSKIQTWEWHGGPNQRWKLRAKK